jgi:acyl-CoA dehydrogenase
MIDVSLSEELCAIREGVTRVCTQFGDSYWSECDESGCFPEEFYRAMAGGGWLGITMPPEFGGSGLGVTAAAIMMHTVAMSGGAMAAVSSIHINLFGPQPVVMYGTPDQKKRWLGPLILGREKACFGVTEPDAGLDTTSITTFARKVEGGYRVSGRKVWTSTALEADRILLLTRTTPKEQCARPSDGMTIFYAPLDRTKIEVRRISKMGRKAVDSNAVFIDDYFVSEDDRIGEEGKGFGYLVHSLNPERILVGIEAVGIGHDALRRASTYAKERIVFSRPIGKNQGIQHPLAECWAYLHSAMLTCLDAAALYDGQKSCGAQANAAKLLGARAGYEACLQSVLVHGGMGYSKAYQVERLLREVIITRIAPITEQLILSFIAEKVLDLPKSY